MTYKSPVYSIEAHDRLLPWWFMIIFVISIMLLSILFFPQKKLYSLALETTKPELIANYYLKNLVHLYPNKNTLRIALIKQQIGLHQWTEANTEMAILNKNPDMATEIKILNCYKYYTQAYLKKSGHKRDEALTNLRSELTQLSNLSLQHKQLLELAVIALHANMPAVALKFYQEAGTITDGKLLRQIATIALQTSQYAISARYYMLAMQRENDLEEKRRDTINALNALLAGHLFNQGIRIISELPDQITNNKSMLAYLTQYLLSANRPDLAQHYILRALMMRGTVA